MSDPHRSQPLGPFFRRTVGLPDDAQTLHHGEGIRDDQWGSRPMHSFPRGLRGEILDCNPDTHSYTVSLTIGDGIALREGVGRLLSDPGDKRILPKGTRVALSEDYGPLLILGVIPATSGRDDNENRITVTGESGSGGEDPIAQNKESAANYRTKNTPRDLNPNDWVQVGEEGNLIGVLGGGVNVVKSSAFAQIRTHLLNDIVEIISRNFRHVSDMGTSEIKNDGGRITWSFRGGADQLTEAGADQENWTIRIDLGAEGDLFHFALTQPDGGTNFSFHVNNEGKLTVYTATGVDDRTGGNRRETTLGDRITDVKGNENTITRGNQTEKVNGTRDAMVAMSDTLNVGNDRTTSIQRHLTETVGGKHEEKIVGGNVALMKPGDLARETTLNAGWKVNIGDPLSGANPAALAGFNLNTFTGDIEGKVTVKGNVNFKTLLGNVTMETTAGIATLKTSLGVANVDGTTVNLGPVAVSMTNPLVKGTMYSIAFGAYTGTSIGGLSPMIAASSVLLGLLAPPTGMIMWMVSPIMSNAMFVWVTAVLAGLSTLLGANAALAAAIPGTLSTKCFTA